MFIACRAQPPTTSTLVPASCPWSTTVYNTVKILILLLLPAFPILILFLPPILYMYHAQISIFTYVPASCPYHSTTVYNIVKILILTTFPTVQIFILLPLPPVPIFLLCPSPTIQTPTFYTYHTQILTTSTQVPPSACICHTAMAYNTVPILILILSPAVQILSLPTPTIQIVPLLPPAVLPLILYTQTARIPLFSPSAP
mmetsp:Transcript_8399/g.4533  ORF Transcript_8399/g.4533 Transcript_8399/m.4533 type:complete len:200 (+) Transcript_8399:911-1510(+)